MTGVRTIYSGILICFGIILWVLFPENSLAQEEYKPELISPFTEEWRWKHFKELDGKDFRDFTEATDGTMWFGIANGLMSYNGYNWNTYLKTEGAPISGIYDIHWHDSTVYVASSNGLFSLKNERWNTHFSTTPSLPYSVSNVNVIENKYVLAGTDFGLLVITDNSKLIYTTTALTKTLKSAFPEFNVLTIDYEFAKPEVLIRSTVVYNSKLLIMGHPKGGGDSFCIETKIDNSKLDALNLQNANNFKIHSGIALRGFTKVKIMNDGMVWGVSQSVKRGYFTFNGTNWTESLLSKLFKTRNHQSGIEEMDDNSVVIAGQGMLYHKIGNNWKMYTKPVIPCPNTVYLKLHKSKNGKLWVGGIGSDVFLFDYTNDQWKSYKNLAYQFQDKEQREWYLSLDNKVVVKTKNQWTYYDQQDNIIDHPVALTLNKDGDVWCAGSEDGASAFSVFHQGKWEKYRNDTFSWGIEKRSIYVDDDSTIWYGSPSGTTLLFGKKVTNGILKAKRNKHGLIDWSVYGRDFIVIDGINKSKNGKIYFSNFYNTLDNAVDSIPEISLNFPGKRSRAAATNTGDIWFGTEDKGIFVFNGDSLYNVLFNNGLLSNTIIDICPVNSNVWIATEKDITLFDGITWITNSLPQSFLIEKRGGSLVKGTNNSLWINVHSKRWTLRSFNREYDYQPNNDFFTVNIKPDTIPPVARFETYSTNINAGEITTIGWSGKDFCNATPQNELFFSYKHNDKDWSIFRNAQSHTFTNLAIGEHSFQLMAKDKFGNTSNATAPIFIKVYAPVWQRVWFIALISFFVIVITYLISRIIVRNQKLEILNSHLNKSNHLLNQKSEELIKTNNSLIESEHETNQLNEELKTINQQLYEKNDLLQKAYDKLKEAQIQLVQSEKMASIGILTAGIAHEINNPLNFIFASKQAIDSYLEDVLPEHKEQLLPLLQTIEDGIKRCTDIVRSLNRFNRTTDSMTEKCKVDEIVNNCIVMLRQHLKDNVKLSVNLKLEPEHIVLGNDGQLHQVFLNIINNAIQAIGTNGEINISNKIVKNTLKILIKDNGTGIAEEYMAKLTDPFFTTKAPGKGTGIGLSISYNIIKSHKGSITFESEVNKGTAVTVSLPLIKK